VLTLPNAARSFSTTGPPRFFPRAENLELASIWQPITINYISQQILLSGFSG
jgi:hypothetical protein